VSEVRSQKSVAGERGLQRSNQEKELQQYIARKKDLQRSDERKRQYLFPDNMTQQIAIKVSERGNVIESWMNKNRNRVEDVGLYNSFTESIS